MATTDRGRTAIDAAHRFADDVLFPTAGDVDASETLDRSRLDQLADGGWYGLMVPAELGGLGLGPAEVFEVIAAFAGGCLTTTLVWLQHHGAVAAIARGPNEDLRRDLLPALTRGERRTTVAFAGVLPNPQLRARPDGDRWIVDGSAPWISGWGLTDHVLLSARTPEDDVVWLLADAVAGDHLHVRRQRLLALDASTTVTAELDRLVVPAERLVDRYPWSTWPARDQATLRPNGSLALGVAGRCCRLMGPSSLDDDLANVRNALDEATPETMPAARAAASALAVRAASALVVHAGSGAIIKGHDAERLQREATVLLVFGSRPAIKAALVDDLGPVERSRRAPNAIWATPVTVEVTEVAQKIRRG